MQLVKVVYYFCRLFFNSYSILTEENWIRKKHANKDLFFLAHKRYVVAVIIDYKTPIYNICYNVSSGLPAHKSSDLVKPYW